MQLDQNVAHFTSQLQPKQQKTPPGNLSLGTVLLLSPHLPQLVKVFSPGFLYNRAAQGEICQHRHH